VSKHDDSAPSGSESHADASAELATVVGDFTPEALPAAPIPKHIGRFAILNLLGQGGMGTVYAAYDPDLDRRVAIKVLRRKVRSQGDTAGSESSRLLREAQAMAKLSHPNVAGVFEVSTFEHQIFIAMEYIDGDALSGWLKHGEEPRPWREVVHVFAEAGRGLAAAHAAGMVHRDFKPDNVLVGSDGRVRVLDFGLALMREGVEPSSEASESSSERALISDPSIELTMPGVVMGTPAYMAPEHVQGTASDAASDQWSFCVALHEGLFGQRPFTGATVEQIQQKILSADPATPDNAGTVPLRIRKLITRGLQRDPAKRFASMSALLRELERDPSRTRRRWLLGTGLAAAVGVGGLQYRAALIDGYERELSERNAVCSEPDTSMALIWGDARRQEIETAILATQTSFSKWAAEAVGPQLDDWAAQWTSIARTVCEATKVDGTVSVPVMEIRSACLTDQMSRFRATTAVLNNADAKVVEGAVALVARLPDPQECATIDTLPGYVALPSDETAAARVVGLRQQLDDVKALHRSGKSSDAGKILEIVDAEAKTLDYLPLTAEVLYERGQIARSSADLEARRQILLDALWAAEVANHHHLAFMIWDQLVFLVGYSQDRPDAARELLPRFDAALHRQGNDPLSRAVMLKTLGVLEYKAGRYQAAVDYLLETLEIRKQARGPDHVSLAGVHQNLGTVYHRLRDAEHAEEHLLRALELFTSGMGPDHPAVATALIGLGNLAHRRKDLKQASAHFERSIAIVRAAQGDDAPGIATSLYNLGLVYFDQKEYASALSVFREGATLSRRQSADGMPDKSAAQIGNTLLADGRVEEAIAQLEALLAELGPKDHGQRAALARFALGRALWRHAGTKPQVRARVIELVAQAKSDFEADPMGAPGSLEDVAHWTATQRLGDAL